MCIRDRSGITFQAPYNAVAETRGPSGKGTVGNLPLTCDDPRVQTDNYCQSPLWAIFCPATCGVVPSTQVYCGAPTIPFPNAGDPQKTIIENYYNNLPYLPKSLAACADRGGHWNSETGLREPCCKDEDAKASVRRRNLRFSHTAPMQHLSLIHI